MAKIIPALSSSILVLAVLSAVPDQARKTAPKTAPSIAASSLASLVRAYRTTPSAARRVAVESWGSTHPKDSALAELALGISAYEQHDYPATVAALRKVGTKLAAINDYVAYYLNAARVEMKDVDGVPSALAAARTGPLSPLAGRSWLVEARAVKETNPAEAASLLRAHYGALPQPEGDILMAEAFQAAGDNSHAVDAWQRVYLTYVTGEAATRSIAALAGLRSTMGSAFPELTGQQKLRHADRLLEIHSYQEAREEYRTLGLELSGADAEVARVRTGASRYLAGDTATAYPYLRGLSLTAPEADAERLYYLTECARKLTDDEELHLSLDRLERQYPQSPWRLKALLTAANRFVLINRPDEYVPIERAVARDFPTAPEAGLAHWRVAFQAYLHDQSDADDLLREHIRLYPSHATAGTSLYFLGRWFERNHDNASARASYDRLARTFENQYYAMLARKRLEDLAVGTATPSTATVQFLDGVNLPPTRSVPREASAATNLRIERSRLLRSAGLFDIADSELRFGGRTDGQASLLAMEMATAADAPHTAMHDMKALAGDYLNLPLAAAPRKFWELLYPLPYRTDLERSARENSLDPFLVAGLIRQESEFDPRALSRANAYGLTQVRPGTGRDFARRAGVKPFTPRLLFQPSTNLKIGTAVLSSMLESNGGRVEETLASYNAGPARLAAWSTWGQFREPAEFVETIPFTETRDYVQAVLRNADVYRRLYK